MTTRPQILVDGHYLSQQVQWSEPVIRDRWPYGCWEMTWNVNLLPGQRPPSLVRGMRADARLGLSSRFAGTLTEIDWDAGRMVAVGACREGEEALSLDALGSTSTTVDTAVDQAIARGALSWQKPFSISTVPLGGSDDTDNLNYVTALLDAWTGEYGYGWYVDANRALWATSDPTTPAWHILPGAEPLASAYELLAGTVKGRYQDPRGRWLTVTAGSGRPEVGVSWSQRGRMTTARAQTLTDELHAKLGAQQSWASAPTVTAEQIITPGGTRDDPLAIGRVKAGDMVRFLDQRSEAGAPFNTDVVLAETAWDVDAGTLGLTPQGKVARDLRSIVADMGGDVL